MATIGITMGTADNRGRAPVTVAEPRASEAITSSSSSQQSSGSALKGEYITVTASGGAVWVAIGADPTAASGTTHLVPDGGTLGVFNANTASAKVAIIDA